jgi:adenylate cyclase
LPLAKEYAAKAIANNPNEPLAHCIAALAAIFEKKLDLAKVEIDKALAINPNHPLAHNLRGSIHNFSGEPLEAITAIEHAMRLDPGHSQQFLHFLGLSYLLAGKYETSAALLRQRISLVPDTDFSRVLLASALGHLGELDEARRVWRQVKEVNPKYVFREHIGRQPFKHPEDVQRIIDGLAKAGLPDDSGA